MLPYGLVNPNTLTDAISNRSDLIRKLLLFLAIGVFAAGLLAYMLSAAWPGLPLPARFVPQTLLGTLLPPFSIILVYELFLLVLSATGSVVTFVRHLFEVVSLILLRDLFKRLDELSASFNSGLLTEIAVVAVGAVALYALIEVLQRLERHFIGGELAEEIPGHEGRQQRVFKDVLELLLLVFFLGLTLYEGLGWLLGWPGTGFNDVFINLAFSGVIIYSVFLLLLVLTTIESYETLFEHSALVLTAVIALVAFEAPIMVQVGMLLASLLFVIVVMLLHGFARGKSLRYLFQARER